MEGFSAAYQVDPNWAIANLTTWLVWVGAAGALANLAVVAAAFIIQRSDHRRENRKTADTHVAALQSCEISLELFDIVVGGKGNVRGNVSLSDVVGRLQTFKKIIDYYLSLGISNPSVVNTLMAFTALYEQTLSDLKSVPHIGPDKIAGAELDRLYAFRKNLRDGAERVLLSALQMPVKI